MSPEELQEQIKKFNKDLDSLVDDNTKLSKDSITYLRLKEDISESCNKLLRIACMYKTIKPNLYKLFLGFRKIGSYPSVEDAKKDATAVGPYNILGPDGYRESWFNFDTTADENS